MANERPAHDDRLLDLLGEIEGRILGGRFWRVVREERSVFDGSRGAGRWNPSYMSVLYGATAPDGAIAEIHYHLTRGHSVFPSRMRHVLHELEYKTKNTLVLADMEQLTALGVDEARYKEMLYDRTQEIADAAAFLGFDGIMAPSARWSCQVVVLFMDAINLENIEALSSSSIDWNTWRSERRHQE